MNNIIKLIYDSIGETLTVYFDDPEKSEVSEETGDGIILIKDKSNNVIGFEKLYFKVGENINPIFQLETNIAKVG